VLGVEGVDFAFCESRDIALRQSLRHDHQRIAVEHHDAVAEIAAVLVAQAALAAIVPVAGLRRHDGAEGPAASRCHHADAWWFHDAVADL
jgi:hypothetical protein